MKILKMATKKYKKNDDVNTKSILLYFVFLFFKNKRAKRVEIDRTKITNPPLGINRKKGKLI